MKLKVQSETTALDIELPDELDMATVNILVQSELGGGEMTLSSLGQTLSDPSETLQSAGFADGDIIYAGNPPKDPWREKWANEMATIKANPYQLSIYKQNHPPLAEAIENGDIEVFSKIHAESQRTKMKQERERMHHRMLLQNDPFNVEAQRALEEEIQQDNIESLRQQAMEHMPESFAGASIVMLYINVVVNGVPLKAFVDSGAQMTIMSSSCAERCGMLRLVDTRYQGMAVGVGQQKIVGRVHMAQLSIADSFLPTSFSILENQPMDMLLGLDMLKRHRCIIDLQNNCLRIGTTGTSTPFLTENEIPAREGGTAPAGSSAGSSSSFPEDQISSLMKLGFGREQVIGALEAANGNSEAAAGFLLGS